MSKIIITFLVSLFFVVDIFGDDDAWSTFKVDFRKEYNSKDESKKRKTFEDNLLKINDNNKKYEKGSVSYKLVINKFADLTPNEISKEYCTKPDYKRLAEEALLKNDNDTVYNKMECDAAPIDHSSTVPESIDWRQNAVTAVEDQGKCCCCWAFRTTGVIEGQIAIKRKKLVPLSKQELVDCETLCSSGCDKGYQNCALLYVRQYGLATSQDYPYTANNGICKANLTDRKVYVDECYKIEKGKEDHLKVAVALYGPISVVLQMDSLLLYGEGIYNESCTGDLLHAVLVVGYNKDQKTGTEYWIIKNSFGPEWGENGYLRLQMGKNLCGIAENAFYATIVHWPGRDEL